MRSLEEVLRHIIRVTGPRPTGELSRIRDIATEALEPEGTFNCPICGVVSTGRRNTLS
jgi:hypothetical protein